MNAWLDFAEGPMFRFAFAVMVLGLLRLLVITIRDLRKMKARARDKSTDIGAMISAAFEWLRPLRWFREGRPAYTVVSIIFHVGLIIVPLFFLPHVTLWRGGTGLGWTQATLPFLLADALTLITIGTGVALVAMRAANDGSRKISTTQDWLLTPLCVVIFVTGFVAAHPTSNPFSYEGTRLVHVLAGNLIFVLMPFTKLAHVVLLPFTHAVTDLSWKFVPGVGRKVRVALNHQDKPI